jgi:hypothetical protein
VIGQAAVAFADPSALYEKAGFSFSESDAETIEPILDQSRF